MCCHKQLECDANPRGDSKTTELNWNGFFFIYFFSFVYYCKFNDLFIVFLVVFFSVDSILFFIYSWFSTEEYNAPQKKKQQ